MNLELPFENLKLLLLEPYNVTEATVEHILSRIGEGSSRVLYEMAVHINASPNSKHYKPHFITEAVFELSKAALSLNDSWLDGFRSPKLVKMVTMVGPRLFPLIVDYISKRESIKLPDETKLIKRVAARIVKSKKSLDMSKWHTCNTTHCLGGWAVQLVPALRKLEDTDKYDTYILAIAALPSYAHMFFDNSDEVFEKMNAIHENAQR